MLLHSDEIPLEMKRASWGSRSSDDERRDRDSVDWTELLHQVPARQERGSDELRARGCVRGNHKTMPAAERSPLLPESTL